VPAFLHEGEEILRVKKNRGFSCPDHYDNVLGHVTKLV